MIIEYTIRPSYENDLRYIVKTWKSIHRKSDKYFKFIPSVIHAESTRKRVLRLLSAGMRIIVAADPQDLNHILGFLCFSQIKKKIIVHFVYVGNKYRKKGLAIKLLTTANKDFSPYEQIITTSLSNDALKIRKAQTDTLKYRLIYVPDLEFELADTYVNNGN